MLREWKGLIENRRASLFRTVMSSIADQRTITQERRSIHAWQWMRPEGTSSFNVLSESQGRKSLANFSQLLRLAGGDDSLPSEIETVEEKASVACYWEWRALFHLAWRSLWRINNSTEKRVHTWYEWPLWLQKTTECVFIVCVFKYKRREYVIV